MNLKSHKGLNLPIGLNETFQKSSVFHPQAQCKNTHFFLHAAAFATASVAAQTATTITASP